MQKNFLLQEYAEKCEKYVRVGGVAAEDYGRRLPSTEARGLGHGVVAKPAYEANEVSEYAEGTEPRNARPGSETKFRCLEAP